MSTASDRRLGWLLASNGVSNLADGIGRVAFPLLAATLTRDPVLIAGLSATQFLPWLLFALVSGALLDRIDRRKAMITANVLRAGLVAVTAGLVYFDAASIWLVYACTLLLGTAETVADSAPNVLIPSLVTEDRLEGANSKLQATEILGQTFLGGPIGSATFAVFATFPFLLNSVCFALGAALLLGMAGSYRPGTEREPELRRTLRADLRSGLGWLRRQPLMLRLVAVATALSLISELAQAQLVLYALEDLGLSEAAFGVFALIGGVGGIVGAAGTTRLIKVCGRKPVLLLAIIVCGLGFLGMGISDQPIVSAALFGVFAAAVVAFNVVVATTRHALVPSALLGRVLGVWRTIVFGAVPVGALAGGLLTDLLGSPSATFATSGAVLLALAACAAALLGRFPAAMNSAERKPRVAP